MYCFRPQAQTAALRQAERLGIASDLQNRRRKDAAFDCGFGKPEGVLQLAWTCIKELVRLQTEIAQTYGVRGTCFQCRNHVRDPQDWQRRIGVLLGLTLQHGGKRQRKAAASTGLPQVAGANLRNSIKWQAAINRFVERRDSKRKTKNTFVRRGGPLISQGFAFRSRQGRRGLSFKLCNGFAERKKLLARHGRLCHDVLQIPDVPVMFLWIPEAGERVNRHLRWIYSCL